MGVALAALFFSFFSSLLFLSKAFNQLCIFGSLKKCKHFMERNVSIKIRNKIYFYLLKGLSLPLNMLIELILFRLALVGC